jgi:hypothetical protein
MGKFKYVSNHKLITKVQNNRTTETADKKLYTITMLKTPPQGILDAATPQRERRTVFQLRGCPQVLGNSLKKVYHQQRKITANQIYWIVDILVQGRERI